MNSISRLISGIGILAYFCPYILSVAFHVMNENVLYNHTQIRLALTEYLRKGKGFSTVLVKGKKNRNDFPNIFLLK